MNIISIKPIFAINLIIIPINKSIEAIMTAVNIKPISFFILKVYIDNNRVKQSNKDQNTDIDLNEKRIAILQAIKEILVVKIIKKKKLKGVIVIIFLYLWPVKIIIPERNIAG